MKIQPITVQNYSNKMNYKRNVVTSPLQANTTQAPNFKGKGGSIIGILAGGAVAVIAAATVAPVLICGAALTGAVGGMVGDKIGDKISGKKEQDNH